MKAGLNQAIQVFQNASRTVKAYRSFLRTHHVQPSQVYTQADFERIPLMDKKNYLQENLLHDLVPHGQVPPMLSSSSGSSGRPFYWPWGEEQERQGADLHWRVFDKAFHVKGKRTLVIVCFSMGTWIAGTYTTACCRYLSRSGKKLTVISPGIEKEDALSALKNIAPQFERVILAGYPPFLMDVVGAARERKIPISKLRLSLLFAGEHFSDAWRDHIHGLAGIIDPIGGSVNIYGTADAAILGMETPLTVFLRRQANKDKRLAQLLWGAQPFAPTVIQYEPRYKYFEIVDGEIVFTTTAGIPLIRYNIHDRGIIYTAKELRQLLANAGYYTLLKSALWSDWQLPFLMLGSRSDVALTFYAVNIYPQNIKNGLESAALSKFVTGKFLTERQTRKRGTEQVFHLTVELRSRVKPSHKVAEKVQKTVFANLVNLNSEYRRLHNAIGVKAYPEITLLPHGHSSFLIRGSKIKWIKK